MTDDPHRWIPWESRITGFEHVDPEQLLANPLNARRHPPAQREALRAALSRVGWVAPVIVNTTTGNMVDGHARVEEALSAGLSAIPVCYVELSPEDEAVAIATLDPIGDLAVYDTAALAALLGELPADLDAVLAGMLAEVDTSNFDGRPIRDDEPGPGLVERFGEPPLSVLDARSGRWQQRKRRWIASGVDSGAGRSGGLIYDAGQQRPEKVTSKMQAIAGGTSVFDPVLCELAYRWFTPPGGHILDPFAGGSVRGIVGGRLGRRYTGIDLRPEQIEANQRQAEGLDPGPTWIVGDAGAVLLDLEGPFDGILSCPPYHDLEKYSDDPADLSNMRWPVFLEAYRQIIARAVALLADNRFVVWVIGEVRDSAGLYRGLVPETIRAFSDAGCALYNEAILVEPLGTKQLRMSHTFPRGRKIVSGHQNVLVFVKGDWRAANEACGPVEVADADLGLPAFEEFELGPDAA